MAYKLAKNLAKVTIGAGAVYITVTQGVWSSNTQSSIALHRVQTTVLPATNEYLNKVPSSQDVNDQVVKSWNSGVETVFDSLAATPQYACDVSKRTVEKVKQLVS